MTSELDRIRPTRRSRGMTLLEVMVAMGVLAVGMAGLAASLMGAMTSAAYSKSQMIALQDAKALMEVLQELPQAGSPGDADTLLDVATNINLGNQNPGGAITLPIGAQANRPGETFRVSVIFPPGMGAPVPLVPVLPATIPNATRDEYEILVVVSWFEGRRFTSITVRTIRNLF